MDLVSECNTQWRWSTPHMVADDDLHCGLALGTLGSQHAVAAVQWCRSTTQTGGGNTLASTTNHTGAGALFSVVLGRELLW